MLFRHRLLTQTRFLQQRRRASTLPPLPPQEKWRESFPHLVSRVFVRNEDTADRLANSFLNDEGSGSTDKGKVVIEAFPGPGLLTRSLLKLPKSKIRKLIVLEEEPAYLKYLEPLQEADPRVVVVPQSGFNWSTYTELEARGLLDEVERKDWKDNFCDLHWVAQIENSIAGDQLTSQILRLIPERTWLFKYGRVPLSITMNETMIYKRLVSKPKGKEYCRLSVVAQGSTIVEEAVPTEDLAPYSSHFFPPVRENRVAPLAAANIYPQADPLIARGLQDKWDYILRRLFVVKGTPLKKAINSLGPGAKNLLPKLTDPSLPEDQTVNINKQVREMDLHDWSLIVKVFDEWPFAPEDLQISDSLFKDIERGR